MRRPAAIRGLGNPTCDRQPGAIDILSTTPELLRGPSTHDRRRLRRAWHAFLGKLFAILAPLQQCETGERVGSSTSRRWCKGPCPICSVQREQVASRGFPKLRAELAPGVSVTTAPWPHADRSTYKAWFKGNTAENLAWFHSQINPDPIARAAPPARLSRRQHGDAG